MNKEIKGTILIDPDKKTISIKLDNGSWCHELFSNGLKRFVDEEIELLSKK
jgi:hypothetical protein